MRDAAAKFLTQFPLLDVAKPLLASQALTPKAKPLPGSPEAEAVVAEMTIEAVPINDQARRRGDGTGTGGRAFAGYSASFLLRRSRRLLLRRLAAVEDGVSGPAASL